MDHERDARLILKKIKMDDFFLLQHANTRASERGLTKNSVIECAKTCFHYEWQETSETYLFLGSFNDSEDGGFSAVLRDQVLVVTVFRRRLTKWERSKKLKGL